VTCGRVLTSSSPAVFTFFALYRLARTLAYDIVGPSWAFCIGVWRLSRIRCALLHASFTANVVTALCWLASTSSSLPPPHPHPTTHRTPHTHYTLPPLPAFIEFMYPCATAVAACPALCSNYRYHIYLSTPAILRRERTRGFAASRGSRLRTVRCFLVAPYRHGRG